MSQITKLVSLDGVEYLRVCNKFRLIGRCLSSVKQSELSLTLGQSSRPFGGQKKWPLSPASSCIGQSRLHAVPRYVQTPVLFRQPVRCYSDLPPHQTIALPALSPTMESGSIVSWEKAVGDEIAEGDVLCEVETDKATMGFEASEPGFLAKILVPAGTKGLALGSPLCVVVGSKAEVAAFENYTAPAAADGASTPAASQQQEASSSSAAAPASKGNLPPHKAITLPALSPTMEMGTIVSWEKKEGDFIKEGDLLAEIETDKAVQDLNNRWFGGRPVHAELTPVTDFREACCRQYEMGECTRGGFCNFMHLKPISRDLRRRLYNRSRRKHNAGSGVGSRRSRSRSREKWEREQREKRRRRDRH